MVPVSCPGQAGHRLPVLVDDVTLFSSGQQDYHAASRIGQDTCQVSSAVRGEDSSESDVLILPELDLDRLALLMTVTPTTFSSWISSLGVGVAEMVFLFRDFNLLTWGSFGIFSIPTFHLLDLIET